MKQSKGFTLIELLVVIAIIGILSAIVFGNVNSIRKKVKVAAALQAFHEIELAMHMYYEGNWPQGSFGWDYTGESRPPPFVPTFYPSWNNPTWYCKDCRYTFYIYDNDWDRRASCAYAQIHNMDDTIKIYKYILCEDCPEYCTLFDYVPK